MLRQSRFAALSLALLLGTSVTALAQETSARFLGREDIILYGLGLKVEPAQQTVPKDIATIVSTYLQTTTAPDGLPPFSPDAEVRARLVGPSFATPRELVVRPNSPFSIPPLTVPGVHTLENIRLVSNGEVLMYGAPQSVRIEVIERLLVTQVTARPLSAAEIREKGIAFNKTNFQAYNFSAAFAIQDKTISLNFPVLLPSLESVADQSNQPVTLQTIGDAPLPTLQTIIPDTLRIQTQLPNLSVVGFTLRAPTLQGQQLLVPPIPGVIAIPGDIGFLNQFFSVMLMVGNVAPPGSGLIVSDVRAEIVLPPGYDGNVGSGDDPLAMAQQSGGEAPRVQFVVQPGLDAKLGTADDIATIGPGETGNAEYLVEGRREGSHVIEMQIAATLHGLPVGPVPVTGRAAGAVLVRNPKFTLTFTHPDVVSAGEPYTLDVTVTNTSASPANLVSLNLYPRNVVGATIAGEPTRQIESIPPGDSATVSFDLISRTTGKVTAATLDSNENVAGRFELKTGVGELGVPTSPDSLVLPKEASTLPQSLRDATIGLLGKAWAVATAPAAAVPPDLSRFSKKIVLDRAIEAAEAGLRVSLHEPLADSVAQLAMDFIGSNYNRLATLVKPADLAFEQDNYRGFDELRRKSVRGDAFARAVAAELAATLQSQGMAAFHRHLGERWSYRPSHVSVFAGAAPGSASPYELSIVDASGRRLGGSVNGKTIKEIPYGDLLLFLNGVNAVSGELAILAAPQPGPLTVRLRRRAGVAQGALTLSLLVPTTSGALRQVTYQLAANETPAPLTLADSAYSFTFDVESATTTTAVNVSSVLPDPAPTVISVVQQKDADQIRCDPDKPGFPAGRIVAVLFSEEVTAASVQDRLIASKITNYAPDANRIVGVALQPGRRIAFLALRDPIGPFVARSITISNVADLRGTVMSPWSGPMETTVSHDGAVVRGRVLDASGTPIAFADVRLFYQIDCGFEPQWVGIAAKTADENGRYSWDYVAKPLLNRILAVNADTDEFRNVQYNVQAQGQQLNVDIVFLGRGSIEGVVRSEAGLLLPNSVVRVTSLTDQSQYSATTDASGHYAIARVPVGNIFIEAVNVAAKAQFAQAEVIPMAGAVVQRDLTLLDVEQRKITVKHGTIRGRVYREDGVTPVFGLPVFAYYYSQSQPGVSCPPGFDPCPIARTTTALDGSFEFVDITAGRLKITSFDQTGLSQAELSVVLGENATATANLLLSGGVGTVKGRVLTSNEEPVNGAQVGGGLALTTTNDKGEFTLLNVPVGRREIVAVSQTLGAVARTTVDVIRAGEIVSTTLVFDPQGAIAGRVVQANGTTPVANVKVYAFRQGTGGGFEIVGSADTDAQGGYRIEHVPAGTFKVSAFSAGFTDGNIVTTAVKFNGQTARADVRFRGGAGRITGVVLNDNGNTPLRARVGVSGDRVRIAGGLVGVGFERVENFTIADSDFTTGQFVLSDIFVGSFTLNAVGQFSPDPISFEGEITSPGQTVNVELRLQPTSQIRGSISKPDGTPAPAEVIVRYKSEAYKVICTTTESGEDQCASIPQGIQEETVLTDSAGRFWLPVVNAGPFSLTIEDPNSGRVAQARGSVRPGETAEIPVRLLARGSLQVRVRGSDTTTVIPGAKVTVTQLDYPKFERERTADPNGVVDFAGGDGLSEGDFVVEAVDVRNGFSGRGRGRITTDGVQVVLNVHLFDAVGTVHGIIYDSDGFTPVPNADVIVSNTQGPLAFSVTAPDGTYTLAGVPLGPVSVDVFDAKSGRRSSGVGQVDFSGQQVPINVVLSAIGLVKGIVLDSNTRAPLKGWTVTLAQHSASGVTLPTLTTTTGVDGRFTIPGAARGTFTLQAHKRNANGSGQASGALDREGQIVDVPMLVTIVRPLRGTISGAVLTSTGAPAANAIVEVCASCQSSPTVISADANGLFALPDVALGRFSVRAKSQTTHDAGLASGELLTDGEVASVVVAMEGVAQVTGTVERADGSMVVGAHVVFEGLPATACGLGGCTSGTDGQGRFSFVDQPARSFTVTATDPISQLKGTAGGPLADGEHRVVRIVLAPSAALSGRAMTAAGQPASGIVAELIVRENTPSERRLYKETNADGTFAFPAAPLETYRLKLFDPVGLGIASRTGQLTGAQSLGDIVLDEAPPAVTTLTPAASSRGVPLNQHFTIVFSEPIQPATKTAANIELTGPTGAVAAELDLSNNDTTVVLTPLAPLSAETRYTLRVKGITDRVGRAMSSDYTATLTTVDVTVPSIAEASPAANTGGVTIYSPIRIRFSEPIDPTKFVGQPITLTILGGANVSGRLDYLSGNTILVFTPLAPLTEDTVYQVRVATAKDLSGNGQASPTIYQFSTTDRTRPVIPKLIADNDGKVIENGIASVRAELGTTHDVLFVDFYLNGQLAFVDRAEPFVIQFQATPQLGKPGSNIAVAAIATDTSGNRQVTPTTTSVMVIADQAPAVTITTPSGSISAANGQRIVVDVRATDDLGVNAIGYRAATGRPADALTRTVSPPAANRTESFAFNVPNDAEPGSVIAIEATAADTFGHIVAAAPVQVTVLDSVSPVVAITGATTGAHVAPGQTTTVVVTATDQGSVASIAFNASGVTTKSETRQVSPAQKSVVTSFTVTVPSTAQPGQSLILDATAVDKAGNSGIATRVTLPIADSTPPVITLAPENGVATAIPGRPLRVTASATDETGITRINVSATGAVTFTDARQVTPPLNSAVVTFDIPVPANATVGSTIAVQATATDISNRTSTPAALTITVVAPVDVSLPASAILDADQSVDVNVQLAASAPPGGVTVTFTTSNSSVVTVPLSIVFSQGETTKTLKLTAVAGGTAQVRAFVSGVERATMTVTVAGGVVSGVVRNSLLQPVAGANVTVTSGATQFPAVTDGTGKYRVVGVNGPFVSVRVTDPVSKLYGHATETMDHLQGVASVNVVLIPAGAIAGTVTNATGVAVGEGVRVDIFSGSSSAPLATTFTADDGTFEFPLVTLGDYTLQASSGLNRGRANVSLATSGQQLEITIKYLGAGTVSGTVRIGGVPVPDAKLTFETWSIFGRATPIVTNATNTGTYSFTGVPIGSFVVTAEDLATQQKGSATGEIAFNTQSVTAHVNLASYGIVTGTVRRADNTTIVSGAVVRISDGNYSRQTETGVDGSYRFEVVPLGNYTVTASEAGTRSTGSTSVAVDTHLATKTANIQFLPQGRLRVTVNSASGQPVPSAFVRVNVTANSGVLDEFTVRTGGDGTVLIDHVLAGSFSIYASFGSLDGAATGALAAGELKNVTIALSPTGSITGIVSGPDGSPVAGAKVTVVLQTTVTTNSEGVYRIDGLRAGRYDLEVTDGSNRMRARTLRNDLSDDIVISINGEVVTRNFTMIGLGSVTGRVSFASNGQSAGNVTVVLNIAAPHFESVRSVQTDGGGVYRVVDVPVGPVSVVVSNTTQQLYGEASGVLTQHGAEIELPILLTSNAITLPRQLWDANNRSFDVQSAGQVNTGSDSIFNGDGVANRAAFALDVSKAGSTTRFAGGEVPTIEDSGREIVVRQENVFGLSVTRKIFVPRAGYFARYLEILRNPTASPVTVDLKITGHISGAGVVVDRSSSGDTTLDVSSAQTADTWFVAGRSDTLGIAYVFDGAGAASRVSELSLAPMQTGTTHFARAVYGWSNVTIPAGGTVAVMHFGVQQLTRQAARASAERLAAVPPEALSGLSADELTAIRNFVLPANGQSTVAALPALTGSVTGKVLEGDETTPIQSSEVKFQSEHPLFPATQRAFSAADGRFTMTGVLNNSGTSVAVPLAGFTLRAQHPSTQIVAPVVPGGFAAGESAVERNVIFTNAGALHGIVRRHNGTAVTSGNVSIVGGTPATSVSASVAGDASYRAGGLPAGNYTLTASIGNTLGTGLQGTATATVATGPVTEKDIFIEPTGTLSGIVKRSSTQVAANVTVKVTRQGFARQLQTDSGGLFMFTDMPVGTFTLTATEPVTEIQTSAPVTIAVDHTTTQELMLITTGRVIGTVTLNGVPQAGQTVTLRSMHPLAGRFWNETTDNGGAFAFNAVPLGAFSVTVFDTTRQLYGEATGRIDTAGQQVTVPITLVNNAITLPVTRWDASNFTFDLQPGGEIRVGTNDVFGATTGEGGAQLELQTAATPVTFTGNSVGTYEDGEREIATRQTNVAGVDVTRKVFVPRDGYFARYLEILTNPTPSPLSVTVRLRSRLGGFRFDANCFCNRLQVPDVVQTSSGDNIFSPAAGADQWVTLGTENDVDPFDNNTHPALAFVFGGPNAALVTSTGSYTKPQAGSLAYAWQNVTIAPGATVAFMHFVVQQTSRGGALASAQRLIDLPPEALAGLSAVEIAAIRNFAVPASGVSTLEPLPLLTGTIQGRTLSHDGSIVVPGASLSFKSSHPLFGRRQSFVSDATTGAFTLTGALNEFGSSVAVPIHAFMLSATQPTTSAQATVNGSFAANTTSTTRDVPFTGTGTAVAIVTTFAGAPIAGANVQLEPLGWSVTTDQNGRAAFPGLQPGSYAVATIRNPLPPQAGTPIEVRLPIDVNANQTRTATLTYPSVGGITGRLLLASGAIVPKQGVTLSGSLFTRNTVTNGSGVFLFDDVPEGVYQLSAYHPQNQAPAQKQVVIFGGQIASEDLPLPGSASVTVTVNFARGAVAPGTPVYVRHAGTFGGFNFANNAGADGKVTIASVPEGEFVIRAHHPQRTTYFTDAPGSVTANGANTTITVVLPALGSVHGTLRTPAGAVVQNFWVQIRRAGTNDFFADANTDTNGNFRINGVPIGEAFHLATRHRTAFLIWKYTEDFTLQSDAEDRLMDVSLPAAATLNVQVRRPNGTGWSGLRIEVSDSSRPFFDFRGNTNSAGDLAVADVAEGAFTIRVRDPNTGTVLLAQAVGTIRPQDDATTVPFPIVISSVAGHVQGHVLAADQTSVLAGVSVQLLDAGESKLLKTTTTDANGQYTFSNVLAGPSGFIVRAISPRNTSTVVDRTGAITTAGETVTVDVPLPVTIGTISGVVTAATGHTPIAGAVVNVKENSAPGAGLNVFTNALGIYQVPSGAFGGPFTITAQAAGVTQSQQRSFTAQGQAIAVDFELPGIVGSVSGVVYAGDKATPLPQTTVRAVLPTGVFLKFATTDADGNYSLPGVFTPGAFDVQTNLRNDSAISTASTITFTSAGQQVSRNLIVPAAVVKGHIANSDGSAADDPEVFLETSDLDVLSPYTSPLSDGNYLIVGAPTGAIRLTVQGSQFGLTTTIASSIVDIATPVVLNVTLPATGSVTGRVLDATGNAVPNANVRLQSESLQFDRWETANELGIFTFTNVPEGPVSLASEQFSSSANTWVIFAGGGTAVRNQSVTINLTPLPTGTVTGRVLSAGQPVPNAGVSVSSFYGRTEYSDDATTDSNGVFTLTHVPAGEVYLTTWAGSSVGKAEGTLAANATLQRDITLGTAVNFNHAFDGSDGFRYTIANGGELRSGGKTDGSLASPYSFATWLEVNGDYFCCPGEAAIGLNNRQITIGPELIGTIAVSRKVFVPQSGGFARYLDVVYNATSMPRTVTMYVGEYPDFSSSTRWLVAPTQTNRTYAVADNGLNEAPTRPAVGFVMAGAGNVPVPVSSMEFRGNGFNRFAYRYVVTVPPQQRVAVLHYAIQREPNDSAGAQSQAQSLVSLSDPRALEGLSAAEKAMIVNFVITP